MLNKEQKCKLKYQYKRKIYSDIKKYTFVSLIYFSFTDGDTTIIYDVNVIFAIEDLYKRLTLVIHSPSLF